MALLHFLNAERERFGFSLSAVHCEHGIRGEESLQDMRLVQRTCKQYGVPLTVFAEDCIGRSQREKCSLETAARNFRNECFETLIQAGKADFIATAHHQNDEAETVLFRLARGSALSGAAGMKEESGYILRPFLAWTKAEILQYVEKNDILFREDQTNFEKDATRNKLRLDVLPALENAVKGAGENLARFAKRAEEDDELLYRLSKVLLTVKGDGEDIEFTVAFSEEKPLFTRACLAALKGLGVQKDYTSTHLSDAFALQNLSRGAKLVLPRGVEAEKRLEGIVFYRKKEREYVPLAEEMKFSEKGFDGGMYEITVSKTPVEEDGNGWRVLKIDKDKLPKDAVFRFRKEGDEIEKFGGGRKSLKKFFNEKKLDVEERAYLPLVASKTGKEVYVVCGVEISETVKITEQTQNALYMITRKKKGV